MIMSNQSSSLRKELTKKISYIKHIPGGKRFWKIGRLYQLKKKLVVSVNHFNLVEVCSREHRKSNVRWKENPPYAPWYHPNENWFDLEKDSIIMLINKPNYKSIIDNTKIDNTKNHIYYLHKTPLIDSYQIHVQSEKKIGWILLNKNISPKIFFKPVI